MTAVAAGLGRADEGAASWLGWPAALAIAAIGAMLQWAVLPTGTDVSWLLTVGERVLGGETLYVDVLESNPPASVLIYLPAVALEHVTGARAETIVVLATIVAALLSLAASSALLARAGRPLPPLGLAIGATILIIFPAGAFAQREHIALLAMLPLLALTATRLDGWRPSFKVAAAVGLLAGVAMAIKPLFALAALLPAVTAAVVSRSPRAMVRPEHVVAGVAVVAYGAAAYMAFPAFFETMLPILREVYLPAGKPAAAVLGQPGVLWLAALLALIPLHAGARVADARTGTLLAAAIGFAAAFVIQHKGWAYHALPAFGLALFAAGFALAGTPHRSARLKRLFAAATFAAGLSGMLWMAAGDGGQPDLRREAAALIKGRTVTAITSDISLANPLTRDLGGRFVGTMTAQWITGAAYDRLRAEGDDPAVVAASNAYIALDRRYLTDDIVRRRPEVVLVEAGGFDWLAWARADPAFAAAFDGAYERALTADGVEVWTRRGDLPAPVPAG